MLRIVISTCVMFRALIRSVANTRFALTKRCDRHHCYDRTHGQRLQYRIEHRVDRITKADVPSSSLVSNGATVVTLVVEPAVPDVLLLGQTRNMKYPGRADILPSVHCASAGQAKQGVSPTRL